ncbi:hypothetical protein OROMI_028867 [Orobanche minor]
MANATVVAERGTSDMLIVQTGINIEMCDIINMEPANEGCTEDTEKNSRNKSPKIQLLVLFIAERDFLHDMVKILKKKTDLNMREKNLVLIDTRGFRGVRVEGFPVLCCLQ